MIRNAVKLVTFLVCLVTLPLIAQTQMAFTVGGNYWYAQRTLSGEYYRDGEIESKPGNMVGPYLNLRIGNVILGGSAFWGNFTESNKNHEDYKNVDAKRTDINGSLGISLVNQPNFSFTVFGAIKSLTMKRGYSYIFTDNTYKQWPIDSKYEETGMLFGGGVSCVIRFPESPVFLFGSASFLQGDRSFKNTDTYNGEVLAISDGWGFDDKGTAQLSAVSGGIGFQTGSNVSILIGYRADILDFKLDLPDVANFNGKENLGGLSVTMAYTFR
jgi:hypothetical protein